jgi:multidrug transporter EmrE-like cation transporter
VKPTLTILSSTLTAFAALPYIIDIVRGRARPRIASWGIWTVVQAVGTVSAFTARQLPGACYTLFCAAGCAAVVFLGWRHGSRDFGPLDAVCVALAAEGVALLAVATALPRLVPMSWAVAVSVATDFLAYLPTFRHAWLRPDEEPWLPYGLFAAAAALVLWVADYRILAGVIYPLYLFAADAAMVLMILLSPHARGARPLASRPRGFQLEPLMRLSVASGQWRPVTGRDWRQN